MASATPSQAARWAMWCGGHPFVRYPDQPLFLARHCQTEWNSAGRYQGTKNSALTERGRLQEQELTSTNTLRRTSEPGRCCCS
ncbi:histidine phosphatase family protein [Henriciella sp. AS95]|uniref:histidine phosphatase family protein n=1 Tax=Henriciella sp. AS95 TaxID=3135782 RepID=UPI00319E66F6